MDGTQGCVLSVPLTKTDGIIKDRLVNGRFTKGAAWSIVGNATYQVANLLAGVACARLMSQQSFGQLNIVQSTVGMFGVLASFGLALGTTKLVAQFRTDDPDRAGRVIGLSCLATAITSMGVVAGQLLFADILARNALAAPELASDLRIASLLLLFNALNGTQLGALSGLESFGAIAKANLTKGLITLLVVPLGALYGGLRGAVWATVFAAGVTSITAHLLLDRVTKDLNLRVSYAGTYRQWREVFNFAIPSLLGGCATVPVAWLSNALLVNSAWGYAGLAMYNAAERWRLAIMFLPSSIGSVTVSLLSHSDSAGNRTAYNAVLRSNIIMTLVLTIIPGACVATMSRFLISIYGKEYVGGSSVLVVLAISSTFVGLNTALGQALVSLGLVWQRSAIDMVLGILYLLLNMLWIPEMGPTGMALANLSAFAITCLILCFVLTRRLCR